MKYLLFYLGLVASAQPILIQIQGEAGVRLRSVLIAVGNSGRKDCLVDEYFYTSVSKIFQHLSDKSLFFANI